MIKRKLIVWWCKLQRYPYSQPKTRNRLREIRRGLAANRKRVDRIVEGLRKIPRGPVQ